jgi:hypothetical protein
MRKIYYLVLIFLGFLSSTSAQTVPQELLGKWVVSRELPAPTISCWGEGEARKLIGTSLEYSSESFRWQAVVTKNPIAKKLTVTATKFHDDNSGQGSRSSQVTFQQLGIKADNAVQVTIQHPSAGIFGATGEIPGDSVLIKDNNTIIFSVCNVYFEAKRIPVVVPANAAGNNVWFHQRVSWQAGSDPRPWEATVESPDGKQHYKLALVPLWAVEGGIVAIQILVAHPDSPDKNLLGERTTNGAMKFVITVEELERGIKRSRFGTSRNFNLDNAKLSVEILGSRLGKGLGDCPDCTNIQEFTAMFSIGSK